MRFRILICLAFILALAAPAYAQELDPQPGGGSWHVIFWPNRWLAGEPVLETTQAKIDWDWGSGSPDPAVPADSFSARWTGSLNLKPGDYRFTTSTDDGVRLWVNSRLLIDEWYDQALTSHSATIHLAGSVPVRMEYFENTGVAAAHLTWQPANGGPPPGQVIVEETDPGFVKGGSRTGWREASEGHGGHLLWTQNNDRVRSNYNWGRWYPNLNPARYEVFVYIPDRYSTTAKARYWVSHSGGYTLRVVNQSAKGGQWVSLGTYRFRGNDMDYVSLSDVTYEPYLSRLIAFDAVKWVPAGGGGPPPGVVITDDTDPGFVKGGSRSGWREAAEGYGGHLTWTQNNDRERPNYNWARWYANLRAERYEVFVYIPDRYSTTAKARYWISHSGGYTLRIVNQSAHGGQWVSLGTYRFRGDDRDYVSLADVTYEPYLSRLIAFDAVKWVPLQ